MLRDLVFGYFKSLIFLRFSYKIGLLVRVLKKYIVNILLIDVPN